MLCSLSQLQDQDLAAIQSLESELGVTMLAFSCHDTEPTVLDKDAIDKIQALEKKMGLSLVAVNS